MSAVTIVTCKKTSHEDLAARFADRTQPRSGSALGRPKNGARSRLLARLARKSTIPWRRIAVRRRRIKAVADKDIGKMEGSIAPPERSRTAGSRPTLIWAGALAAAFWSG